MCITMHKQLSLVYTQRESMTKGTCGAGVRKSQPERTQAARAGVPGVPGRQRGAGRGCAEGSVRGTLVGVRSGEARTCADWPPSRSTLKNKIHI